MVTIILFTFSYFLLFHNILIPLSFLLFQMISKCLLLVAIFCTIYFPNNFLLLMKMCYFFWMFTKVSNFSHFFSFSNNFLLFIKKIVTFSKCLVIVSVFRTFYFFGTRFTTNNYTFGMTSSTVADVMHSK